MHSFIQSVNDITFLLSTGLGIRAENFCGPHPALLSLSVLSLWQEVGNAPVAMWRKEEAHIRLGSHQCNNE